MLERLKEKFVRTDALKKANLLLAFHGCTQSTADSICSNGFANVATRDNGYFGNGIYLTTCAQYACEYANGTVDGSAPFVAAQSRSRCLVDKFWSKFLAPLTL